MELQSLPTYPPPLLTASQREPAKPVRRLSARQIRTLISIAWLISFVLFVIWLKQTADAFRESAKPSQPIAPLAYDRIVERFSHVGFGMESEEVFKLLGPMQFSTFPEPEFDYHDRLVEAHPDRYHAENSWAKWANPADSRKWVAVFFSGGVVYKKLKKTVDHPATNE